MSKVFRSSYIPDISHRLVLHSSRCGIPAGGLVAVGANNGKLALIDTVTGDEEWSYPVGSKISSVPVIVSDEMYVFDDAGIVWCFASP